MLNNNEVKIKFNLTNIEAFQYNSVTSAIKQNLKSLINIAHQNNNNPNPCPMPLATLISHETSSKEIYARIIQSKIERPSSELKLSQIYQTQITATQWESIYSSPFYATIDSKLRSFQFKISHNIYYTNIELHRDGISETQSCTFCNNTPETIHHLFLDCQFVAPLWILLENIFEHKIENLTVFEKNFGTKDDESGFSNIINHMLILVKYYIHVCKVFSKLPSIFGFKAKIKSVENIERAISIRKQKLELHESKWQNIPIE